jgi:putative SOS response-associated peptidase YedK
MPLILSRENESIWLDDNYTETDFLALLTASSSITINNYPVSPVISNIGQDLASMILPTPPSDQHGNLTLFD